MATFRLSRVLRLRTQLRRLRVHEAETLAGELSTVRARGAALAAAREERARAEAAAGSTGLPAPVFQLGRQYDAALADDESRCRIDEGRLTTALAAKRAEVEAERREERKLEQLRSVHGERAAEDDARRLGTLLDELALRRHDAAKGGRP